MKLMVMLHLLGIFPHLPEGRGTSARSTCCMDDWVGLCCECDTAATKGDMGGTKVRYHWQTLRRVVEPDFGM